MAGHRWRTRLQTAWGQWSEQLARERAGEPGALDRLDFPVATKKSKQETAKDWQRWIEHPLSWVCPDRGLGDYPRFLLVRGFGDEKEIGVDEWYEELQHTLSQLKTRKSYAALQAFAALPVDLHRNFNGQKYVGGKIAGAAGAKRKREFSVDEAVRHFSKLVQNTAGWELIAHTVNRLTGRAGVNECTGEQLRNRRFDGPNAIDDFLTYLRTGAVALRQAPYGDQLRELHRACSQSALDEEPAINPDGLLKALCHTRGTQVSATRHYCLWSRSHPTRLLPAALELLEQYDRATDGQASIRRLPAIYVPLRAGDSGQSMSRRKIVGHLFKEICINRARPAGQRSSELLLSRAEDSEIAEADGAQLEREVKAIRDRLAREPTLLIFGIHHVADGADEALIEEHTLDSPLPYVLNLLMPETGDLRTPIDPRNAFATRVLILADGSIENIANQAVLPFELKLPAPKRSRSHAQSARVAAAAAGEMELSLLDAALHLQGSWEEGNVAALIDKLTTGLCRSVDAPCSLDEMADIFVDHLLGQAHASISGAWFATILQLAALVRGGVRADTLARVLTGYAVCTSEHANSKRSEESKGAEMPLWSPASTDARVSRLEQPVIDKLQPLVLRHIDKFKDLAAGLVRLLRISPVPGLDDYEHCFESPEVPEIRYATERSNRLIDFEWPRVQLALQRRFREKAPEKHTLLRLLMSDECARRAAIVQRHSMAQNHLSLLQKRYVISAINHGLDGLSHECSSLLGTAGSLTWRWVMNLPGGSPRDVFLWIYQELYTNQLNGHRHLLSKEHGAEELKRALIEKFLDAWRNMSGAALPDLKMFLCLTDLHEGRAHVAIRTADIDLERKAQKERDDLIDRLKAALASQPEETRDAWIEALRDAARRTLKLKLDGEVIYELAASSTAAAPGAKARAQTSVLDALPPYVDELMSAIGLQPETSSFAQLGGCLKDVLRSMEGSWPPGPRAKLLLELTPRDQVQFVYDCLVRFAQILAVTAEQSPKTLRQHAFRLFELADSLRLQANDAPHLTTRVEVSPRPMRYAARLCLTLGETNSENRHHHFERSAYYAYNLITATSQYHIERIASLIIHASTIRIRGAASDSPRLDTALKTLKQAEQALIHYPHRSQLWIRFYLERARIFRDQALSGRHKEIFATYCEHDLEAVRRLAPKASRWRQRADGVLKNLKAGNATLKTWNR